MTGSSQIELHVIVTLSRTLILRHLEVHHLRKVHSGWSQWMSVSAAKSSPLSSKVVPPLHHGRCCCCCCAVNRYLLSNSISQNLLQLSRVQPGALGWTQLIILWGSDLPQSGLCGNVPSLPSDVIMRPHYVRFGPSPSVCVLSAYNSRTEISSKPTVGGKIFRISYNSEVKNKRSVTPFSLSHLICLDKKCTVIQMKVDKPGLEKS